jgi:N-acetyl-anhydromuramyl-L-alanine amidase AmpD
MQVVERVIVHHSGGASGNVEAFRKQHIEVNGWQDVGYHFIVGNGRGAGDGEVQHGRAVQFAGAHCPGQNDRSIGVCLVGDFTGSYGPSMRQRAALVELLTAICLVFDLDPAHDIADHNDFRATDCPGPALEDILPSVRTGVAQRLAALGVKD